MKTFIDTLFVIALVNERDRHHERALQLASSFQGHSFVVTDAILLEIGNGLARRFRREAVEIIESFLVATNVQVVPLTTELFARAFELYKARQDKEWGLIDCISFTVMRDAGIGAALTSDRRLVQAGFEALLRDELAP
jgi:predicted nucleic acid-binding protein